MCAAHLEEGLCQLARKQAFLPKEIGERNQAQSDSIHFFIKYLSSVGYWLCSYSQIPVGEPLYRTFQVPFCFFCPNIKGEGLTLNMSLIRYFYCPYIGEL